MLKFKFLTGDINWQKYGGKFVSKKLNNGDFDYWLVLDVTNMHEATGDENQDKYIVEIHAVSPEAAGKTGLDAAFSSAGMSDEQLTELENDPLVQVETLNDYGIFAMLKSFSGNNLGKLMREARREANMCEGLFGFYMDRQENRIGQSGWDLIRGQDIREFLGVK